jgi:hypothetical protein
MKRILALAVCSVVSIRANADPELSLALKGGPNTTTLTRKYRVHRYGISSGLAGMLRWSPGQRFAVSGQLELLHSPRGAEVVFEGASLGKLRQHYLDLVVAVRPELRIGRASAYLLLGAGVGFLASASNKDPTGWTWDATGDLRRLDVTLLAGAGGALHLPRRGPGPLRLDTVFLEARRDHGLIDIDRQNGGFMNRSSSLLLGVSFTLAPSKDCRAEE